MLLSFPTLPGLKLSLKPEMLQLIDIQAGLYVIKSTATSQPTDGKLLSTLNLYQPKLLLQASNYALRATSTPNKPLHKLVNILKQ